MHASSILDFISAHHESALTDDLENNRPKWLFRLAGHRNRPREAFHPSGTPYDSTSREDTPTFS
jgi:hypothetical protein